MRPRAHPPGGEALRWHVIRPAALGPLHTVALAVDAGGSLRRVRINPAPAPPPGASSEGGREAVAQITAYLQGRLKRFTLRWVLPDNLSAFRRTVLEAVARIPFGATLGYGDLAAVAGHPDAARAVGGAMGANPLPLVIPCHRVLAAGGRLGGFTGGVDLKRRLLALEGHSDAQLRIPHDG